MTFEPDPRDFCYDVETPLNVFTCTIRHIASGTRWIFEISPWINQAPELVRFVYWLRSTGARMVGFNNEGFDYPIIHALVKLFEGQGYVTAEQLHAKAMQIIGSNDRFGNMIWVNDRIVPQVDLYKIHHFDNVAKATSLKTLQFNMRSYSVEDLPFDPNQPMTSRDQVDTCIRYNAHDVDETIRFYNHSLPMIRFRDELSLKYGQDFTNYNDTKIGKEYFIMQLEQAMPGACFDRSSGRKQPRQTFRRSIPLRDVILPYVSFTTPEFSRVLDYLRTVEITNTKSAPELKDLHAIVRGFRFDFGTGGIHGSVHNRIVRADPDNELIDVDVKSYYPNLAIKNGVYPAHLGMEFCRIYSDLYDQRAAYPKGSAENAMLKLALNGVYGDSNNLYSPFYDPAYTMAITINGQLLLCILAEWFLSNDAIEIIQINTDGMTVRVNRSARAWFDQCCEAWQHFTQLELESVNYSAMFIRDVNNYLAVDLKGKVKRIGAYAYETQAENVGTREMTWNKDWSALIVPRAVEEVLVRGADLSTFIYQHADPFDFMLRAKVNRDCQLVAHHQMQPQTMNSDPVEECDQPLQNTTRYHIARSGPSLVKIMPPLAKAVAAGKAEPRRIGINVGWPVRVCNIATDFSWHDLDRTYYIEEAQKLMGMKE